MNQWKLVRGAVVALRLARDVAWASAEPQLAEAIAMLAELAAAWLRYAERRSARGRAKGINNLDGSASQSGW